MDKRDHIAGVEMWKAEVDDKKLLATSRYIPPHDYRCCLVESKAENQQQHANILSDTDITRPANLVLKDLFERTAKTTSTATSENNVKNIRNINHTNNHINNINNNINSNNNTPIITKTNVNKLSTLTNENNPPDADLSNIMIVTEIKNSYFTTASQNKADP
ncbi:hypothetical protein HELRODRAFT_182504 [Helobdella robusta]|uniref:Uncharacterized protein n=1 Tax=Helobdella robusta TaxID=6412 RepID=T1FIA3_HELRO|nr:hypothetical protein HELRODRAFT_182504 [Helobdella robusta]ESN90913.1 hypothetical protein HELRODRAFT_182504 [Helobdella robusta]